MPNFQPEQASLILESVFLPTLHNEHRITKGIIEAIPADKQDYSPNEIAPSALKLAWHFTTAELMFMEAVIAGEFKFAPNPMPDSMKTASDVTAFYASGFEEKAGKLAKLQGEQLSKILDFRGFIQLPVVMFLGFAINHSIHHRGQLSTYLRPMGAKVPVIYGESYDSKQASA